MPSDCAPHATVCFPCATVISSSTSRSRSRLFRFPLVAPPPRKYPATCGEGVFDSGVCSVRFQLYPMWVSCRIFGLIVCVLWNQRSYSLAADALIAFIVHIRGERETGYVTRSQLPVSSRRRNPEPLRSRSRLLVRNTVSIRPQTAICVEGDCIHHIEFVDVAFFERQHKAALLRDPAAAAPWAPIRSPTWPI
jgi:hypothetical protein